MVLTFPPEREKDIILTTTRKPLHSPFVTKIPEFSNLILMKKLLSNKKATMSSILSQPLSLSLLTERQRCFEMVLKVVSSLVKRCKLEYIHEKCDDETAKKYKQM
jgi:hypothetical protein